MRRLTLILSFVLLPAIAQAACSADGYTVVFVNGVFDTKEQAEENRSALHDKLGVVFNNQTVNYITGYNETHLQGSLDLAKEVWPSLSDHDLQTILMHMHDEVTTRKLLIVGHSQGAEYANKIYDYLTTHGVPADAVAVYAVATPVSSVAGGGNYVNYQGDDILYGSFFKSFIHPPPPNITYKDWWEGTTTEGPIVGHKFIDQYLTNFPDKITTGIKTELFVLRPTDATEIGACFAAPEQTLGYKATSAGLAVVEPIAIGLKVTGAVVGAVGIAAVKTYDFAYSAVGSVFAGIFGPKPPDPNSDRAANDAAFAAVKAIYGSSLDVKDVDQLQRDAQKKKNAGASLGAAAILAFGPDDAPAPAGEVLGSTTEATGTVPFPTAESNPPAPMPGADVHYNAPAFGGPVATQEVPQDAPPAPPEPPVMLQPPAVTLNNWHTDQVSSTQYCGTAGRTVDILWGPVPGAVSYSVFFNRERFDGLNATDGFKSFHFYSENPMGPLPAELAVVAYDGGGNAATTTLQLDDRIPDKERPSVISFTPETYQAANQPLGTVPTLTFSEPVDPASFLTDRVHISKDRGGTRDFLVPQVHFNDDHTILTLTPPEPLEYSTTYRGIIECTMADLAGNHPPYDILLPYFTTADAPVAPTP